MGAPRDFRSAHLVRYKTYNGQLFIIQQFVDKNGHIGCCHRDRDCDSRHLPTIVESISVDGCQRIGHTVIGDIGRQKQFARNRIGAERAVLGG